MHCQWSRGGGCFLSVCTHTLAHASHTYSHYALLLLSSQLSEIRWHSAAAPNTLYRWMFYDVRGGESHIFITTVIKFHTQQFKMGFAAPACFHITDMRHSLQRHGLFELLSFRLWQKAAFCFDDTDVTLRHWRGVFVNFETIHFGELRRFIVSCCNGLSRWLWTAFRENMLLFSRICAILNSSTMLEFWSLACDIYKEYLNKSRVSKYIFKISWNCKNSVCQLKNFFALL